MESHTGTDTKEIDDVVASGSSGCVDRLLDVVNMSSIDFLPWAESVIDQVCFTSDTASVVCHMKSLISVKCKKILRAIFIT